MQGETSLRDKADVLAGCFGLELVKGKAEGSAKGVK
jgi:hypothetical protein